MEPLRIHVRKSKSGLLIADSPDLKGLHAMERTQEELIATLYDLIPLVYAEQGVRCEVTSIYKIEDDQPAAWVVAGLKSKQSASVG